MRPCGECRECCTGNLEAVIYSHKMENGKPCHFLKEGLCTVYSARPKTCRQYFCGWAQELIPEDLRPDKSGYIVSVKDDIDRQYLEVLQISEHTNEKLLEEVEKFVNQHNTFFVKLKVRNI